MPLVNVPIAKKLTQGFPVKLRIVSGAGNAADIYKSEESVLPQEFHKLIEVPGGMTNRENYGAKFSRLIHFTLSSNKGLIIHIHLSF